MNICITGALGHIGSALIRDLDLPGIERVYLVDNLLTQRYPSLFDLPEGIQYDFHQVDILSDKIEPVIADSDIVVHLAAVTNAEESFHHAAKVEETNKKGLKNVAELCARHKTALLFPSSTSVYGVQEGMVDEGCGEEDLKPQSPYAESKLYAEKLLQSLGASEGLRFVTLRLGTIFGYSIGMRFHTAVNKFIWQACMGEPITVWKTALHQKRPYCDLQDCIGAILHVIRQRLFDGTIYNVLTVNLTVNDIVQTIKRSVPELSIELVDSPIMNQLSYEVSNRRSVDAGFDYKGDIAKSIPACIAKLRNISRKSNISLA